MSALAIRNDFFRLFGVPGVAIVHDDPEVVLDKGRAKVGDDVWVVALDEQVNLLLIGTIDGDIAADDHLDGDDGVILPVRRPVARPEGPLPEQVRKLKPVVLGDPFQLRVDVH